ncbi:MAG: class II glutamine amidotransferase [Rhodobacteraceae bacterium]|nr:class II glutamine amidotransferase [Paracoccaceae bacterium]
MEQRESASPRESDPERVHPRACSRGDAEPRVSETNCHPFVHDSFAFMHNGDVGGFARVRRPLLASLSDEAFGAIQGATDSEHAFALFLERVLAHGRDATAAQMVDALRRTVTDLVELVERHAPGEHSYLNIALSNGRTSLVTRFSTEPDYEGESLHLHRGARYVCDHGVCRMVDPDAEGFAVIAYGKRQ